MIDTLKISEVFGWFSVLQNQSNNFHSRTIKNSPVVGLVVFRYVINEIELLTLGVVPEMRRQGIGTILMQNILSSRKNIVLLEVAANNIAAISLYYKLGFEKFGKRLNYYQQLDGTSIDAFTMKTM